MATATGQTPADTLVLQRLAQDGPRVSFFQALTLLERRLGGIPLGHEGPADGEGIRVRPSVSLACPPSDIESIELTPDGRVQVTTTFLGLYGVDSPLPNIYAERIAQDLDEPRGQRVRDFLDLFHHRLYSLLFRVWKKTRPVPDGGASPLHDRMLSLIGYSSRLGLGGQSRPRLSEVRMRVLRPRTAVGLEALLKHRLGYLCGVEQIQPRMVQIPPDQLTRLGQHGCVLGGSLVVGRRVADCNKIALQIEAESLAMFENLLPEGPDRAQLDDVIRGYLREPVAYDVEVSLATPQVPAWGLGHRGVLGRTVWLGPPHPAAHCRWRCQPLL